MITIGTFLTINLVVFGGATILIGLGIIPSGPEESAHSEGRAKI